MKRMIFGVIAGLITGIVINALIENAAHKFYPPPAGIDFTDKAAVRNMMMSMPLSAYFFILSAYISGAFFGGAVATLIDKSGKFLPSWVVSGLLLLAGVANFIMLPHPFWFMIVSSLCYPVFASAGAWVMMKIAGK